MAPRDIPVLSLDLCLFQTKVGILTERVAWIVQVGPKCNPSVLKVEEEATRNAGDFKKLKKARYGFSP